MTEHGERSPEPSLLFELQGAVAKLTLNRPAARNALTTRVFLDMERMLLEVESDDGVRAIVLTEPGAASRPEPI